MVTMLRFQSSKKNLRLTYFQHILSDFFCQTCQSLWLWVYCSILPHINYNTQTNYNIQCAGFEPLLSQSPPMGCISGLNQCTWDNHYNIYMCSQFKCAKSSSCADHAPEINGNHSPDFSLDCFSNSISCVFNR